MLDRLGQFGERRQDERVARMTMHLVACLRSHSVGAVRMAEFLLPAIDDKPPEAAGGDEVERFDRAAGLK